MQDVEKITFTCSKCNTAEYLTRTHECAAVCANCGTVEDDLNVDFCTASEFEVNHFEIITECYTELMQSVIGAEEGAIVAEADNRETIHNTNVPDSRVVSERIIENHAVSVAGPSNLPNASLPGVDSNMQISQRYMDFLLNISIVANLFSLSNKIKELAQTVFLRAAEQRKRDLATFALASLFSAAKSEHAPRPLEDMLEVARQAVHWEVTAKKTHKAIKHVKKILAIVLAERGILPKVSKHFAERDYDELARKMCTEFNLTSSATRHILKHVRHYNVMFPNTQPDVIVSVSIHTVNMKDKLNVNELILFQKLNMKGLKSVQHLVKKLKSQNKEL